MKRLGLALAITALAAGAALTTASARTAGTVTICHRTTSSKTPYVKLRVSAKALRAHVKHAADIIPAPKGGCPRSLLTPNSGGRAFHIALTGEAESPAADPVGTGTATVRLRAGQVSSATGCLQATCRVRPRLTSTMATRARQAQLSCRSRRRTRPANRAAVRRLRGRSSRRSSPIRSPTT